MKTVFSVVVLIVFGIIANFASIYVLNIAGLPGALVALRNPSKGRLIIGAILSSLGQSYVYLAFVVFVVNWTLVAAHRDDVVGFPLWPFAFAAVVRPVWVCLMHAREEDREAAQEHNAQVVAMHVTFFVALLGFFVFAFVPSAMKLFWGWVPYVH